MRYLDLFAGAGGLSEGFIKAGFKPVAHVEINEAACYTLKTRTAFHYLEQINNLTPYIEYTSGQISREKLYSYIPKEKLDSVICEEISAKTLKSIFKNIDNLKGNESIDLIVGGPPCQAYSLMGRSRDPDGMLHDSRNYLYTFYVKFLKKYEPKYFVFENVVGLLSAKDEKGRLYLNMMKKAFNKAGYTISQKTLNARDYGVLQNRKRIIIVGRRTDANFNFQWPEHVPTDAHVSAIFSDLPIIHAGEGDVYNCQLGNNPDPWLIESGVRSNVPGMPVTYYCSRTHKEQDLEIYRIAVNKWNTQHERLKYADLPERLKSHRNQNTFQDRFKVVAKDESASQTVVAHIAKDGHYYIHPELEQNRSLTPREVARLQTFPDDYYFESLSGKPSRTDAFRQIGNAVPVLLAQKIAESLRDNWNE
ncbi:MAG: DNA cytosine methyltransferase [Treponema sp.]|nr:DNA cytosine methyltransferase [Treponema sp.]